MERDIREREGKYDVNVSKMEGIEGK